MKINLLLSKWSRYTLLSAISLLLTESVQAQCLTNTSQYPGSTVVPTVFDGVTPNAISSCNYEEEYAVVKVNASQQHLFYSSNPNTYITISNKTGTTAFAHGAGQVSYTSTVADTVRVYFNTNASCGTYDDCIETNVIIGTNPICFLPLGMPVATNITNNAATLSWNAVIPAPGGGYEYYYGNPATPPTATTTASGSTAATSASLSLTQNTDYGFWVRAVCGTNNKSAWGMMTEFSTQHIVSRPWTEGFNTQWTMPDGFTADENYWFVDSDPGYFDGNPGHFLGVNQYMTDTYKVETVNISGVLATDVLKFDYRYFDSWDAPLPPPANDGYFKVFISTNMGQTYTQIDSIVNNTTAVWTTKTYPLSAYTGQTIRIKIQSYYTSASGFGDYFLGLDNFFVGGACTPPVVNLGADATICQGTTLTLNPGSTAGATYAWSTGATTPTLAVTTAGTYHVTVTQAGCSASDTIIVSTSPNPTVNLGADTTICNATTYTLDAGAGTGYTYLWSNNATTQTINVTTGGVYSVTVTNANACTTSDEVTVGFSTVPTVNGITATGNPSPSFEFEANGATNAEEYHWDFGHNGATATGATATYTYPSLATPATYTVTLTISNDCGEAVITTVVTVNPVGINDLGLDNNALKLFPNPGSHSVKLVNESNYKMKQIIINNILGQTVATIPVSNKTQQVIDVNRLPAGLYNVRIEFEEGTVIRKLEVIK